MPLGFTAIGSRSIAGPLSSPVPGGRPLTVTFANQALAGTYRDDVTLAMTHGGGEPLATTSGGGEPLTATHATGRLTTAYDIGNAE